MTIRDWIPSTQQMSNAVQLRPQPFVEISMRQALGMILAAGMLGGLLSFVVNWVQAASMGTVLPLAQAAKGLDNLTQINNLGLAGLIPINLPSLTESVNTLAGLDQALPGWMAALLSALGALISLPFAWLQSWLVYGLLVALTAKGLGATMTLQRFYAATGYFAVPLILTNLTVIPYLGDLLGVGISVWALLVYARGVQVVGRLDGLRVVASLVIPLLALAMIYMAFALTMGFAAGILLS